MFKKKKGLGAKILALFNIGTQSEEFFEELEDLLLESDIGAAVTMEVVDDLRENAKKKKLKTEKDLLDEMKLILSSEIKATTIEPEKDKLNVFLILGVNGVGKTTSIAKLATYFSQKKGVKDIVLSAGDTFRAAAIDQLKIHGERTGFRVVSQNPGSDAAAVIFDSIASAQSKGENLILADTAGRMHNKANLVKELEKIDKVVKNKLAESPNHVYKKIMVIDATTGQNGLRQAEIFNEAIGVDGIILTKFDSTAKGGIVVAISKTLGLPFAYIGSGEKLTDLKPFSKEDYLASLLDT